MSHSKFFIGPRQKGKTISALAHIDNQLRFGDEKIDKVVIVASRLQSTQTVIESILSGIAEQREIIYDNTCRLSDSVTDFTQKQYAEDDGTSIIFFPTADITHPIVQKHLPEMYSKDLARVEAFKEMPLKQEGNLLIFELPVTPNVRFCI